MPNASNTDGVRNALGGDDITTEPRRDRRARPDAARRARPGLPGGCHASGGSGSSSHSWNGLPCTVAGTGYTGERRRRDRRSRRRRARPLGRARRRGLTPAGLGARDTLRLEAGLPLHGHELGPGITSLQAGLGWVVAWDKPSFRAAKPPGTSGREGSRADCSASPPTGAGRRAPSARSRSTASRSARSRAGTSHRCSVTASRSLSCRRRRVQGQQVVIDVRGKELPGHVVSTPFVRR